jgi:transcriptional regulator GlxA family with amidase domain
MGKDHRIAECFGRAMRWTESCTAIGGSVARRDCLCIRSELHSKLKSTFGETPHRYLQRRRIERAMYLLHTTDTSVTDICMATGFSSLGSFSQEKQKDRQTRGVRPDPEGARSRP